MALTPIQKHLITGLLIFGVEKDAIVGIVSALETEEQQCRMMEWMSEHEGASTSDIPDIHSVSSQREVIRLSGSVLHIDSVGVANDGHVLIYTREVRANGENIGTDRSRGWEDPARANDERSSGTEGTTGRRGVREGVPARGAEEHGEAVHDVKHSLKTDREYALCSTSGW